MSSSVYGPFEGEEVSIYCDESRDEGQSEQPYMIIGGLWLLRDKRRELLEQLHSIQADYGVRGELKWNKLSRSRLAGYQALVEFLAQRDDVHFRCLVVDKRKVDADKYFQNDRKFGFWVFYWHCLKQWMGNGNTYFVSLDFKPASVHSGPPKLREILERECQKRAWLNSLACVDSRENLFCQLADVLIGAVGYAHNGLQGSETKIAFCRAVAKAYKRENLLANSGPGQLHFNLFKLWNNAKA